MKIKAQLIQPGTWDIPLAECEVEVEETDSEEMMRLKGAHALLQNFDVKIKRVK